MSVSSPRILALVKDSPGDVRLTKEAFREADGSIEIHVAVDRLDAMNFQTDDYVDAPGPDLILLGANLPKVTARLVIASASMDGGEVLSRVKSDDRVKRILTVILTTSAAEDVVWGYELQAKVYLTKRVKFDDFEEQVRSIRDFWLTMALLPQHERTI